MCYLERMVEFDNRMICHRLAPLGKCPTYGRWVLGAIHGYYIGTHDLDDPMDLKLAHGQRHLCLAPFPMFLFLLLLKGGREINWIRM